MTSEFKKNFVLSIVLHVGVLVMVVFVTAFVPAPRTDEPIIMEIVGGGGEPSEAAPAPRPAPPTPPSPPAKIEQPPEPVEQTKPPEPAPARIVPPKPQEMVVPQKKPDPPKKKVEPDPPVKKVEEKAKVEPKPSPKKVEAPKEAKSKLISKSEFEKKTGQTKKPAQADPKFSRDSIRQRLAKNVVKVESVGSGPGPANGLSGTAGSDLAAYCSMLSSRLYEVWEIPGQATPSMSTVVVVRVTSDGSLSFVRIMKPSGSIVMDESAIAAVNTLRKVDPLPASLGRVRELTVTFQPLGA